MKKIINEPDNYLKEMLSGIYIAHKDMVTCTDGDLQCLVSKYKKEGKVGIATGGGSGHFLCFLAMLERACWMAAAWVMYSSHRVQNRCLP